jgi:hypothetical protein
LSLVLHSGPEQELVEYIGPNPEYVDFAIEMTSGTVANLKTPVMQRIAAVWRGEGSFGDRMLATLAAAEKEMPGLWLAIIRAPSDHMAFEAHCYREHFARLRAEIAVTDSEAIREAKTRSMNRQHSDYWNERFAPFRFPTPLPDA